MGFTLKNIEIEKIYEKQIERYESVRDEMKYYIWSNPPLKIIASGSQILSMSPYAERNRFVQRNCLAAVNDTINALDSYASNQQPGSANFAWNPIRP